MRYGLLEHVIESTAYLLGNFNIPYIPYQDDGNWEKYLPKYEPQAEHYETSGCTVWGSLNQLEILYKRLFGVEPNFSERFTYNLVGIDPSRGTDPQKVYECIRAEGVVDNDLLPVPDTLEDFLDKSAITNSLRAKAQFWKGRHDFKHQWLWKTRPANYIDVLRDALKTSPIGVSVSAWNKQGDVYVSTGDVNNHFCVLYKIDAEGYPWVFDSYDHSKKKLAKNHNIRRAKRIWLNRKTLVGLTQHRNVLQVIFDRLMNRKTLMQVCEESIGMDASPRDLAPDELGCAETVSTILKKVYPDTPIITGTYSLWEYMRNPKNGWESVPVPVPGAVIISPTGLGKKGAVGHAGFILNDNVIASNDSKTGKFMKNYTTATWTAYFQRKLLFPMYMYKKM